MDDRIQKDLEFERTALENTPRSHPNRAGHLSNIAFLLNIIYVHTSSIAYLEKAIDASREAVGMVPMGQPGRAAYLVQLGTLLGEKNDETGSVAELDEAIGLFREGINATPDDSPLRGGWLHRLRIALWNKYRVTKSTVDFNEANQVCRQAVDASQNLHGQWNGPGAELSRQLGMVEGLIDRDQAIDMTLQAVDASRAAGDSYIMCLHLQNLADQLKARYYIRGDREDLHHALGAQQEVLDLTSSAYPARGSRMDGLAQTYIYMHTSTEALAHLEAAIRIYQEGLDLISVDHPDRASRQTDMAIAYEAKWKRTRSTDDFEKAVQCYRSARSLAVENYVDWDVCTRSLGMMYEARGNERQNLADLDQAIQLYKQVVDRESPPAADEEHAFSLRHLANGYKSRHLYKRSRESKHDAEDTYDIDMAILFSRKAMEATPEDNPSWPFRVRDLGRMYNHKFLVTNETRDFNSAVQIYQRLLDSTPAEHDSRAVWLRETALLLIPNPGPQGTTRAIELLLEAVQHSPSHIENRIASCGHLLGLYRETKAWKPLSDTAKLTIDLIQSLTPRFLETSDKLHVLNNEQVAGLTCSAAAAALISGMAGLEVVKLLERGRGVLSASFDDVRADMGDLEAQYPELAARLARIQDELEQPLSRDADLPEGRAKRRTEAANEFQSLVSAIREKDGFEEFLLSSTEAELHAVSRYGPIVLVNVSGWRCDALILWEGTVRVVPLPLLSRPAILQREKKPDIGDPVVLEWLWDTVAGPVLDALGFTAPPRDGSWPHVWWIPTDILTKFPLHAAGYHGKGSQTVLDRVMSSYSPSIKAIIQSRRGAVSPSPLDLALLVGVEHTSGLARLPSAPREIAVLRDLCKSMGLDPIIPER